MIPCFPPVLGYVSHNVQCATPDIGVYVEVIEIRSYTGTYSHILIPLCIVDIEGLFCSC